MQETALAAQVNTIYTACFRPARHGVLLCPHEGCGKSFNSRKCLNVHMQTHTNVRPFSCRVCGTRFLRKHDCNVHERIHTGEKPYECFVCHKRFARHSDVKVHEKVHSDDKPFACPFPHCRKSFKRKYDLKKHIAFHVKHTAGDAQPLGPPRSPLCVFSPVNPLAFSVC